LAATTAALDYVEYLLRRFDDDYLHALAAYNAGAAKISRAIGTNRKRARPTDFWSLDLPSETDRYIPRFLALVQIVQESEKFRVELPPIDDEPYFEVIETDFQIDLHVAARLIEMPLEDFLDLNAGFNRAATQPGGPHRLLVPSRLAADLRRALEDLPPDQRLRWRRQKIQKGDTLRALANRYEVTVHAIQRANHLATDQINAGEELLIPLSESVAVMLAKARGDGERFTYRVRKGDSLYVIAKRFQVTVDELRRWNDIVGRLIKPGQRLTLFLRDG
jgi:membrane-bound lytic murein transglycosylase D